MNYDLDVPRWVFEQVRQSKTAKSGLKEFVLSHETNPRGMPQLDRMIQNLRNEIQKAQAVFWRRHKKEPNPKHIKSLVQDFTEVFLHNCETVARQTYESDMARIARETKLQEAKDMESTLQGNPAGIFEELGVIVDETRQDEIHTPAKL